MAARAQKKVVQSLEPQTAEFTKRFLLALPPGAFLASHVFDGPGSLPCFAGRVADSAAQRCKQWKQAVAVGAAHHTCQIFPNERLFRRWLKDIAFMREQLFGRWK